MEDIKLVREERKQLEWTRQELLRKGKDLLAQNRHRRNQGEQKILDSGLITHSYVCQQSVNPRAARKRINAIPMFLSRRSKLNSAALRFPFNLKHVTVGRRNILKPRRPQHHWRNI